MQRAPSGGAKLPGRNVPLLAMWAILLRFRWWRSLAARFWIAGDEARERPVNFLLSHRHRGPCFRGNLARVFAVALGQNICNSRPSLS